MNSAFNFVPTAHAVSQTQMLVSGNAAHDGAVDASDGNADVTFLTDVLPRIQEIAFSLVAIVAVAVFVWIAYNLFSARGNEEEFKKAWMSLVYAVIGLALIPAGYAIVKVVTGFNL